MAISGDSPGSMPPPNEDQYPGNLFASEERCCKSISPFSLYRIRTALLRGIRLERRKYYNKLSFARDIPIFQSLLHFKHSASGDVLEHLGQLFSDDEMTLGYAERKLFHELFHSMRRLIHDDSALHL